MGCTAFILTIQSWGQIPKHEKTLELRVQGLSFKLPRTLINSLILSFIFVASSSYTIAFAVVNSIDGPRIHLRTIIVQWKPINLTERHSYVPRLQKCCQLIFFSGLTLLIFLCCCLSEYDLFQLRENYVRHCLRPNTFSNGLRGTFFFLLDYLFEVRV